jgi:hypothetical protein
VSSEAASTLGVRLAEMDRLLRDIQAELVPGRVPASALVAAPVSADPAAGPERRATNDQIHALTELSERLLASMRELLAGYERLLTPAARTPLRAAVRRQDAPDVILAAGPFPDLPALREFERALSRLPGVREVAVQAYQGSDRAIIDVRLDNPTAPNHPSP